MDRKLDLDFENICRICLLQSVNLQNLFTTEIVDDHYIPMTEILDICIGVKICKSESLPKKICELCKTTVLTYYKFKEKCKQTESVLQEMLLKGILKIEITDFVGSQINVISKNIQVQNEKNELKTEFIVPFQSDEVNTLQDSVEFLEDAADFREIERSNIENAIAEEPEIESQVLTEKIKIEYQESRFDDDHITFDDDSEITCELCKNKFDDLEYFQHCKLHHFICLECNKVFNRNDELKDHEQNDHNCDKPLKSRESLYCSLCKKRMTNREQLNNHMKLHSSFNLISEYFEYHVCHECRIMFLKAEELDEHKKKHKECYSDDALCTDYQFLEDEKSDMHMTCGLCNDIYLNLTELKYHIISHFETFNCPFEACGCEYESFSRLSLHIMKKHIYVEHFCTHCKKHRFKTFDELQEHIRNKCSAKKFECTHCEKKFFSNKALKLHLKNIKGKKYMCQFCGKSFSQQGELTIHNRTHTGERPFKCTLCGKTYKTASMRSAHMDAHIEGKTFLCTICGTKLQTRTSYRNHMKRHTEEKKYVCDICSKKFFTKYHLKSHSVKIHMKSL